MRRLFRLQRDALRQAIVILGGLGAISSVHKTVLPNFEHRTTASGEPDSPLPGGEDAYTAAAHQEPSESNAANATENPKRRQQNRRAQRRSRAKHNEFREATNGLKEEVCEARGWGWGFCKGRGTGDASKKLSPQNS